MTALRHITVTLRIICTAVLLLTGIRHATAQVDAQFTQYYEVPAYYNAGALGNTDFIRVRAGSRLQWTGIPKAPRTFIAAADMPLKLFNRRWGAGLVTQQESIGLYSTLTVGAQGAYKLKLKGGILSLGVQLGFLDESFKGSQIEIPDGDDYHEPDDDALPSTDIHGTSFDMAIGAFYTRRTWWAGVSVTHLTQPTVTMAAEGTDAKEYEFQAGRTFYFMAGGNIPVKNTLFELQPSIMVKSDMTFTTGEGAMRLRYNHFITGGVGYRWRDAVTVTVGAEWRNLYLGYSYDYPVSAISRASSGSHEIWLGYKVKLDMGEKNRHRHKSIRLL